MRRTSDDAIAEGESSRTVPASQSLGESSSTPSGSQRVAHEQILAFERADRIGPIRRTASNTRRRARIRRRTTKRKLGIVRSGYRT